MCATCAIGHADTITSISFRNSHKAPPKSLGRLRLRELRRQPLQKFTQKAPQPPALKPPSTARTAGRSDWAERRFRRQPFILLSFSSSEKPQKRRKHSHTNDSNASVIWASRVSQTPLQTPIPYFHQWVPHGKKTLVAIACKTAHIRFCG